ncbi:YhcE protein [Bacillus freudenreichii]|nr:YhcE protein [Bacillus freudenreichii]
MTAFFGLLKKDLSLIRFWYMVWLAFMMLGIIAVYGISKGVSEPSILVPYLVTMGSFHVFLAPIALLYMLNIEGKTQLWLYNPQNSTKLLLSKICSATVIQLIAQVIISLFAVIVMKILQDNGLIEHFSDFLPFKQGFYMQLGIFGVSMYMSIWVIFLWTVYHSLGKYPSIRNFRWLAVVLVWLAYNVFEALLAKTKVIQNQLFYFSVNVDIAPQMDYETKEGWKILYADASVPVTAIVLYVILSVIFFLLASWLLDRKVEV